MKEAKCDLCQGKLKICKGVEPWSCEYLICPKCDSTYGVEKNTSFTRTDPIDENEMKLIIKASDAAEKILKKIPFRTFSIKITED